MIPRLWIQMTLLVHWHFEHFSNKLPRNSEAPEWWKQMDTFMQGFQNTWVFLLQPQIQYVFLCKVWSQTDNCKSNSVFGRRRHGHFHNPVKDKCLKCTHFIFVKSHGRKGGLGILGEVAGVTLVADSADYIYIDRYHKEVLAPYVKDYKHQHLKR